MTPNRRREQEPPTRNKLFPSAQSAQSGPVAEVIGVVAIPGLAVPTMALVDSGRDRNT